MVLAFAFQSLFWNHIPFPVQGTGWNKSGLQRLLEHEGHSAPGMSERQPCSQTPCPDLKQRDDFFLHVKEATMGPRCAEAGAGASQAWLPVTVPAMRATPAHHEGSITKRGMVAHACYPSSSEVETRGPRVRGRPRLHF